MRLSRLDLVAFGPFDRHRLDFGAAPEGPDLHIVYGRNEAGKSSLLEATVQLLCGMPLRNPWAFGRDYDAMQIDAILECDGEACEYRRFKRWLANEHNERIDNAAIDLHGLDEPAFRARFSLDDAELRRGGEAILDHKGELGEALYSAAAGLADLGQRLRTVGSDRFYDWSGTRDQPVNRLRKRLEELDAKIAERDIDVATWRERRDALEAAREAREFARTHRDAARQAHDALKERLGAFTLARDCRRTRRELAELGAVPVVGTQELARFRTDLKARDDDVLARAPMEKLCAETAMKLDSIAPDPRSLERASEIEALRAEGDRLERRAADTASYEAEANEASRDVAELVREVALPVAADELDTAMLVPLSRLEALEVLAARHGALDAAARSARTEHARLEKRLAGLEHSPAPAEGATEAAPRAREDRLSALLAQVEADAPRALHDDAAERFDASIVERDASLAALSPWRGDLAALKRLAAPSDAELGALDEARRRLAEDERDARAERTKLDAELERVLGERMRLETGGDVSDAAVDAARASRDAELDGLRTGVCERAGHELLEVRTSALAHAIRGHDALVELRMARASVVTRLRELDRGAAAARRELERLAVEADALAVRRADIDARCAALCGALGLEADRYAGLRDWLTARRVALEAADASARAEAALRRRADELEQRRLRLASELGEELGAASDAERMPGFEELLRVARVALDRLRAERESRRRAAEMRADLAAELPERERERNEAAVALSTWRDEWDEAVRDTPLQAEDVVVSVPRLPFWRRLHARVSERATRRAALAELDDARRRWTTRCRALADALEVPTDDDPAVLLHRLETRLRAAREGTAERTRLATELDRQRAELARMDAVRGPVDAGLEALRVRCAVPDLDTLIETMRRAACAENIGARLKRIETDLVETLDVADADAALALLADEEREATRARVDELAAARDAAQAELDEREMAWRERRDAVESLGDDAELQRLRDERQRTLDEIEAGAREALRARLGGLVIDAGIQRFRERNRGEMMEGVRDAFTTLTRGRFVDLRAQPGENGREFLVGVTADGKALRVEQMSEGTSLQLYLALRIAAYHAYAARRTPLPFVADDILQTADDARSEAAFELLDAMARHGQVIYLTHHRHVVEIAERATHGRVRVHELPGPAVTATVS